MKWTHVFMGAIVVAAMGLGGCATLDHTVDHITVLWRGNTLHVTRVAADRIADDTSTLLDAHYRRDTTFEVIDTGKNLVTDAIVAKLLSMGFAVDLVNRNVRRAREFQGEVPIALRADNMGYKDIVRIRVDVDRVTAQRIYTSESGYATGPWTVTVHPRAEVIVGQVTAQVPGSN